MALQIIDEVVQAVAIEQVKDTLLQAQKATSGAITIGKNIHKGDFADNTFLGNFGNPQRRDPATQTAITPDRLSSLEDTAVKLYFRDDVFVTKTELKRYGSSLETINRDIGKQLGTAIARWAIQKSLMASVAAITSQAGLIAGDGTADIDVATLNQSVFKLGDMSEDVKVFVSHPMKVQKLIGDAIASSADSIAYGGIYEGRSGTLNRAIWNVENDALKWVDGADSGYYTLGLTQGAVMVDESEVIELLTELSTMNTNAGYNFHTEGAYTVNVKGFAYKKAAGSNPDDTVLGATTSWDLISQLKASAGVVAKTK